MLGARDGSSNGHVRHAHRPPANRLGRPCFCCLQEHTFTTVEGPRVELPFKGQQQQQAGGSEGAEAAAGGKAPAPAKGAAGGKGGAEGKKGVGKRRGKR